MNILFVSQFATKNVISGNNNVYRQALALNKLEGINVEILTTLEGDHWDYISDLKDRYFVDHIDEIKYHIINNNGIYSHRVLSEDNWSDAVNFGIYILKKINADIIHLQHWRDLWWLLEAAQKIGVKTIYSPHDWGLICLRTILVNSDNKLCDGKVNEIKCSNCIMKRRSSLGKINELLIQNPLIEKTLKYFSKNLFINTIVTQKKIELIGSKKRAELHLKRAKKIISNLNTIVVPSKFAKNLFSQFVDDVNKIEVLPWYYDKINIFSNVIKPSGNILNIGYIGRIASDKGIKRIFEALEFNIYDKPVHFVVAGDYLNDYGLQLYNKYRTNVGIHTVEWLGWLSHENIHHFYSKINISVLISEWVENGPLTLYESFAFQCPVIINDTPNVEEYVTDGFNGLKVQHFSTTSIAEKIKFVQENINLISYMKNNIKPFHTSNVYANKLKEIYDKLC